MNALYAWNRPEVRQQDAERERVYASMLSESFGPDLSDLDVIDVGCGTGGFLRTLVNWGATPERLTGTEFLPNRIELARKRSAPGITWHLGDLSFAKDNSYDLITANTVFSSILDMKLRIELANEIWRILKPGGHVMVFDFRYNNPANMDVRKVTRQELNGYWKHGKKRRFQTLLLAPPLARRIAPFSTLSCQLLSSIPFLRSHFVYMVQKVSSDETV